VLCGDLYVADRNDLFWKEPFLLWMLWYRLELRRALYQSGTVCEFDCSRFMRVLLSGWEGIWALSTYESEGPVSPTSEVFPSTLLARPP
jgi:hypothetical protein